MGVPEIDYSSQNQPASHRLVLIVLGKCLMEKDSNERATAEISGPPNLVNESPELRTGPIHKR